MSGLSQLFATLTTPPCPSWCTDHVIAEDSADASVTEIHRGKVTRGGITVEIEASPQWADDPHNGGPIVTPDLIEIQPAQARAFAAALIEAARLVEGVATT